MPGAPSASAGVVLRRQAGGAGALAILRGERARGRSQRRNAGAPPVLALRPVRASGSRSMAIRALGERAEWASASAIMSAAMPTREERSSSGGSGLAALPQHERIFGDRVRLAPRAVSPAWRRRSRQAPVTSPACSARAVRQPFVGGIRGRMDRRFRQELPQRGGALDPPLWRRKRCARGCRKVDGLRTASAESAPATSADRKHPLRLEKASEGERQSRAERRKAGPAPPAARS